MALDAQKWGRARRTSWLVLTVVGAAVGAAAVVVITPRSGAGEQQPVSKAVSLYDHPRPMEFTFNPIVDRGHKTALITFKFSYRADTFDIYGDRDPEVGERERLKLDIAALGVVPKRIERHWDRAYSRCLEMLTNQRAETLMDPKGKVLIKRMLRDELTSSLFPEGAARVDDILWTKFVLQ